MQMAYKVGIAKEQIKDRRTRLPLQGYADPKQKASNTTTDGQIYSRAFVIEDTKNKTMVAIVVVDFWSCTKDIKSRVLELLAASGSYGLTRSNLMISGTHTHSAPGGYTGYVLFDQAAGGFDQVTAEMYASAIAASIKAAFAVKKSATITAGQTILANCGRQRSKAAFENNRREDKTAMGRDTDQTVIAYQFTYTNSTPQARGGAICWYAIHPTCLGQENTKLSGDCHGEASRVLEADFAESGNGQIVAFANANCGDVSGNVGIAPQDRTNATDKARMADIVRQMSSVTKALLTVSMMPVRGEIKYWYKDQDFSNIPIEKTQNKTWPSALGLSFAAGSTADSISRVDALGVEVVISDIVKEGMVSTGEDPGTATIRGLMAIALSAEFATKNPLDPLAGDFGGLIAGHGKKPIVFSAAGYSKVAPSELPLQIFQIGTSVIIGFPGELTAMAGHKLRRAIRNFPKLTVTCSHSILNTYANDYCQYVTTKGEYDMQHYEGASNVFGPHALAAFTQEFMGIHEPDDNEIECKNGSLQNTEWGVTYKLNGQNYEFWEPGVKQSHTLSIPWNAVDVQVNVKIPIGFFWRKYMASPIVSFGSEKKKNAIYKWEKITIS
jgi:neutral ceramidase